MNLDQIRKQVEYLLAHGAYDSCCFLAAKLLTLSDNVAADVYLLARCYRASGQPLRAVETIEKHGRLRRPHDPGFLECILLAAQCWSVSSRPEEVIRTTDAVLESEPADFARFKQFCLEKWGVDSQSLLSLICLERGKAYEAQDNRKKVMLWMSASLHLDVRCTEALERIINVQLSPVAETDLIQSLVTVGAFISPDVAWLQPIFECSLAKLEYQSASDARFEKVERIAAFLGGPTLADDLDIMALKAEARFNQRDARGAFEITSRIFSADPISNDRAALVHIGAMVELGKTSDLFYFAHRQIKENPKKVLAWYAIGAYYYSAKRFDASRRFFAKATAADSTMMAAWLAYAHAHAMHDESDRAMATYRTTARLFPGSHYPVIGTAMEYLRTNNVALAENFGLQARALCGSDPLVHNELGIVYYRMRRFGEAIACFEQALQRCSGMTERVLSISFEAIMFNLGHALRKLGRLEQAIKTYKEALSRSPKSATGHAALGLSLHLNNQPEEAVECYHVSLGLRPGEGLVEELMDLALKDVATTSKLFIE